MRIVVTGASGQLGSYLLDRLKEGSHEVIAWSGRAPKMRGELPIRAVDLTGSLASSPISNARGLKTLLPHRSVDDEQAPG